MIRIGNAQAFWGDRSSAAADLLRQTPQLDYLTMDYLAEVSMSILAQQRSKYPQLGYPQDFVQVVGSLVDYWAAGGKCRLIANAGGLNPLGCANACKQMLESRGCRALKIGIVSGDDVLTILKTDSSTPTFSNLDDGRGLAEVQDRLITANAYLGCEGIVAALNQGADIVITGRVADPSMVLAACVHAFGWSLDDWDRLAQGTVAGHLLECGTQVSGGISTDWLSVPDPAHIGFPFVEIEPSGRCVVTKADRTGGRVTPETVKEQLVYEIGDPGRYISPDVQVSFLGIQVKQVGQNRVEVIGAKGSAKPSTLKVSATYRDGYRAAGSLTIIGHSASAKACRSAQVVQQRLAEAGWSYREWVVESLGCGCSIPLPNGALDGDSDFETVLRIAVESEQQQAVEAFTQEMIPLVTAGAQGTTGYAEGRPRVHSVYRYWPCLISTEKATAKVEMVASDDTLSSRSQVAFWPSFQPTSASVPKADTAGLQSNSSSPQNARPRLIEKAIGRSGDKGTGANVGILVRDPNDYQRLVRWLTVERVSNYFSGLQLSGVQRFEIANLGGLNFILRGALRKSGRTDAQGKALAQALLAMPLDDEWFADDR